MEHNCNTCKNNVYDKIYCRNICKRLGCTIVEPEINADCDFYDEDTDGKKVIQKRWYK